MSRLDKVLDVERVFVQHIPGCVEADPYVIRYSTFEDLGSKVRHWGRIGCDLVSEDSVTLVDVFCKGEEVQWWVLGTAYNIPGKPPYPHWKEIVRELGGKI